VAFSHISYKFILATTATLFRYNEETEEKLILETGSDKAMSCDSDSNSNMMRTLLLKAVRSSVHVSSRPQDS
jgi:hypothetical protein